MNHRCYLRMAVDAELKLAWDEAGVICLVDSFS